MPWVTVQEASEHLGVSEKTIRRKVKACEYEVHYKDNPKGQPIMLIFLESSDGHSSDGHFSDGHFSDGHFSDGHFSDGHFSEVESKEVEEDTHELSELCIYADTLRNLRKDIKTRESLIQAFLALPNKSQRASFIVHIGKTIPKSTFYRWVQKYQKKGEKALHHKRRNDEGVARKELDMRVKNALTEFLLSCPEWNISEAIRKTMLLVEEGYFDEGKGETPTISEYLVRKWLKTDLAYDKWYNKWYSKSNRGLYPSVSHTRGINPPCTVWMVDDHDQDVLVWSTDKEGKKRQIRPKAIRVIDPETNMIMGWCLTDDTYGSREIKTAILNAIIKHRVLPQQIFIECDRRMRERGNIEGLDFLGIIIKGTPYNPTAKANVEGSFKTDRLELDSKYDSYINNNPQNRPDQAEARVTVDYTEYEQDYEQFCDRWNTDRLSVYRGKIRKTPVEMWNDWVEKGWNPTRIREEIVKDLPYWFGKLEKRTVNAGAVRFTINGEQYMYIDRYIDDPNKSCLVGLPNGVEVDIRRNFLDPRTGYVYSGKKKIGEIKLLEKIAYGFDEYSNETVIEMIRAYRAKRVRVLRINKEDEPFMESYIKYAEAKSQERGNVTMLMPNAVIKFIRDQIGSAHEVAEVHYQRELDKLKLDSEVKVSGIEESIELNDSSLGATDQAITDMLKNI